MDATDTAFGGDGHVFLRGRMSRCGGVSRGFLRPDGGDSLLDDLCDLLRGFPYCDLAIASEQYCRSVRIVVYGPYTVCVDEIGSA